MTREHPFAPHRVLLVAAVVVLAVVAVLWFAGPDWFRRLYQPLAHADTIASEARRAGLDPYLIAGVIQVESGFRAGVESGAGAVGLMQVKPSTARAVARPLGLSVPVDPDALRDPDTNIAAGTRYLASLVKRYDGDTERALAAYNAGPRNVDRWVADAERTGRPFVECITFPATRHYVGAVEEQAAAYRELYPDAFR